MNDFLKAFKEGQELAKQANQAEQEVDDLLNMMVSQVNTEGARIFFRLDGEPDSGKLRDRFIGTANERLAFISFHKTGYPVILKYRTFSRTCLDWNHLQDCLCDFLSDPLIALRIQATEKKGDE